MLYGYGILNNHVPTLKATVMKGGVIFDTDALAFITAASITNPIQKSAVNNLVTTIKANGIWNKFKAIYPMVGSTASSHKFNLKDPRDLNDAYRLSFINGWTHSDTGALPNGTDAYANTWLAPSSALSQNSTHISYYSRTNNAVSSLDMGVVGNSFTNCLYANLKDAGKTYFRVNRSSAVAESSFTISDSRLFYIFNRASSTEESVFTNTTKNTNIVNSSGLTINNFYFGALNLNGSANYFGSKEIAFASIGDGLTDTEASNFYTAVQAFNTTLSRNV